MQALINDYVKIAEQKESIVKNDLNLQMRNIQERLKERKNKINEMTPARLSRAVISKEFKD